MNKHSKLLATTFMVALSGLSAHAAHAQSAPPAAKPATQAVDEVVVTAKFIATGAESATKLNIPVLDTPYSVAAYSRSFLDAIQTNQVSDLYKYMTGVQRSGSTGYDMSVRGFPTVASDRNAIMTDGLPGLSVRWGSPPTIGADHVELVKGPASLLYGQVQPGGFVNIVSKKPSAKASTTVESQTNVGAGSLGSAFGDIVSFDSTGPITEDGTLLYRFIAQGGNTNGWRKNAFATPIYIAPMLTWRISDRTTATYQLEYRWARTAYDNSLVAPLSNINLVASFATRYQSPRDTLLEEGTTQSLQVAHDFDGGGKLNFAFREVHHTDRTRGFTPIGFVGAAQTKLSLRAQDNTNTRGYDFADVNYTRDFDTGPIGNKLIVGGNIGRELSDFNRQKYYQIPTTGVGSYTLDVYNPSYAAIPSLESFPTNQNTTAGIAGLNHTHTVSKATGAYISDFLTFTDQWKALIGVRYSREQQSFEELRAPNVPSRSADASAVLPTVGLLYEPMNNLSFYTSYSTSYVPVNANAVDATNQNHFTPTEGKSIEAGFKGDFLDKRVNVTGSVFKIDKLNVTSTFTVGCPVSVGTCTQQIGAQRSEGGEFEVNARPTPQWQILLGASHLKATVIKSSDPAQVGAGLADVPEDTAHLWTRYDLDSGTFNGLGLGFGASYTGKRNGLIPTSAAPATLPLNARTLLDAALYYELRSFSATLKVSNLSDVHYLDTVGSQGIFQIAPGEPRKVELTLRAKF